MKLLIAAVLFVVFATFVYLPAGADDNGSVNVSITPKVIAISVDTASVSYLDVELNVSDARPDPEGFSVSNDGTGPVDLYIRGANTDDSGSLGWILGSTPGDETYVHRFATVASPSLGDFTPLTTALLSLFPNVAAPGAIDVKLSLATPLQTVHVAPQTTTVEVVATDLGVSP